MKILRVKPSALKRLRGGHQWVFSNEVASNLRDFHPGELVRLTDEHDRFVAAGYVNPRSLISARILSVADVAVDESFFRRRLEKAIVFRKEHLPEMECCRLVYGESDLLPGLVVDKYHDVLVAQCLTAGMDHLWPLISSGLRSLLNPSAVVLRNDSGIRALEGLEMGRSIDYGKLDGLQDVRLNGIQYRIDFLEDQKTGFFLDQRFNHLKTQPYVAGKRVLDCFCYVGAWSLRAASFAAAEVIGLDSSDQAIARARLHASLNGFEQCSFHTSDVFNALKEFNDRSENFDVIILDPPAFAKSRSGVPHAIRGYREINRRAAKALSDGGILVTCSCSQLVDPDVFRNTVLQGVQAAGKMAVLLERGGQPVDHPVLLSMRETEYLKCLILRIFKA